jgi:hypothetical protein
MDMIMLKLETPSLVKNLVLLLHTDTYQLTMVVKILRLRQYFKYFLGIRQVGFL